MGLEPKKVVVGWTSTLDFLGERRGKSSVKLACQTQNHFFFPVERSTKKDKASLKFLLPEMPSVDAGTSSTSSNRHQL